MCKHMFINQWLFLEIIYSSSFMLRTALVRLLSDDTKQALSKVKLIVIQNKDHI